MHGTIAMASRRRGRIRKVGDRHPGGKLVQEKPMSPQDVALGHPHRRDAPEDMRDHHLAETPFGTLRLIGALSGEEHGAGVWFARVVRRYRAVISAPKPDANSIAGAFEPKRASAEIQDATERKFDYDAAFEALNEAGRTSALIVSRVVVHGEAVSYQGFGALVRGLRALRDHRELTERAKSDSALPK